MATRFDKDQRHRTRVQKALESLASVDLIELCNEAKVERCRATRDLRSCGRYVQYVLNSCQHASLCAECSQRCEQCPICRTPIPKIGERLRLRLYNECIEAGLISKRYDDVFQEKEDDGNQVAVDVKRLYSLFDVALENNLVSLICHYVTDVCMDESAVSSDPVIAFLLDEVVVKDWCRRTFGNVIADLQNIYNREVEEMKIKLPSLIKSSTHLTGVSNVLEVLESSIKGTLSAQPDLHQLQDNVTKAKQHLEIMMWSIRHQFLNTVKSRYSNFTSWHSCFRERKSAAVMRSWPDLISNSVESSQQSSSTLFIEDALLNLEVEKGHGPEIKKEAELTALAKDGGSSSFFRSKIEGFSGCYPFEDLRDAIDILFLCGSSDLVVAKRAIFLYYLFDRHWTMPDEKWRHIVDDFAASFGIVRQSVLESLTFYLLDDHTDEALQEACRLLPEISGPATHPKIAQVLLERQSPETALMVLQWSGHDGLNGYAYSEHGGPRLVSLQQAVTSIRVRVECGLLTEAYMYQRTHCLSVRKEQLKHVSSWVFKNELKGEQETWEDQVEALVTEICCLCIRRNLVDRMIELPWHSDEEKHLHKCLLDYATEDPSTTCGSLLVVYYLQRFRYIKAYQVNCKLEKLEQDFILKKATSKEDILRIKSRSKWRAGLVDSCIELLPEVQQQQIRTGNFSNDDLLPSKDIGLPSKTDLTGLEQANHASLMPTDSPLIPFLSLPFKTAPTFETPTKLSESAKKSQLELSDYHLALHGKLLTPPGGKFTSHKENSISKFSDIRKNFKFDDTPAAGIHLVSPSSSTPLKGDGSLSRVLHNNQLHGNLFDRVSGGEEADMLNSEVENSRPQYPSKFSSTQINAEGLSKDFARDPLPSLPSKRSPDRSWMVNSADNSMDFSSSRNNGVSNVEDKNANGGPRWRSDETSEDEEEPSPEMIISKPSPIIPRRGTRRIRSPIR